jgi:hypothetical protein
MTEAFPDLRSCVSRLAIVFAVSLVLTACGPPINVPPVTSRGGFVHDPKLGTIVIGQIFTGNGAANASCPYRMLTSWVHRTPPGETADMKAPRQFDVSNTACAVTDKSAVPAFSVFQIQPGDYILHKITRHSPFTPISNTDVRNTSAATASADGMTVPRFSVAAGEAVYVGNVVLLNAFPAEMRGASTPEPARAALRAVWPEGAERMVDRRMLIGPRRPQ